MRILAGTVLAFFFAVTIVTTVVSLGAYCLTSDGGNTRALTEGVSMWEQTRAPTPAGASPDASRP